MHKDPAKVLIILLQAMIKLFDPGLFQESQHAFFQLAAALARDNLHFRDLLFARVGNYPF